MTWLRAITTRLEQRRESRRRARSQALASSSSQVSGGGRLDLPQNPPKDDPGDSLFLDVLLKAYEVERETDTAAPSGFIALLTAYIGLSGLVGALFLADDRVPRWLFLLAPLPTVPFMALGALVVCVSQARALVILQYEEAIRKILAGRGASSSVLPTGSMTVQRVWRGWYGNVVVALIAFPILGSYVSILVASYHVAHPSYPCLALTMLISCGFILTVVMLLYVIALFPEWLVGRESRSG